MIDRQELMEFARELSLDPKVVEKDYILGWLLAGIANHPDLAEQWVFKGGTCLKKCYFETYRFSEDLDFTISEQTHFDQNFLVEAFRTISAWIYDQTGIEIPADQIRFDVGENKRGGTTAEGRVYYVGPLQQRRNLMRIKLDLTNYEVLVLEPARREVHHPYSDKPASGIFAHCYCFEEVFAEKVRALAERERPRDLYDVVHLYRHDEIRPDRTLVMNTLQEKCNFKGIPVPTRETLLTQSAREKLLAEWEDMLAHQLQALPSFEQFWAELPMVLDWLHLIIEKPVLQSQPRDSRYRLNESWQPPAMVQAWHEHTPIEAIRFAAANRLCVKLQYQGSWRLIEPYSLRMTSEGNILLCAVRHDNGGARSYRFDRIQGVEISKEAFIPRYLIELTPSGPLSIATVTVKMSSPFTPIRRSGTIKRGGTTPTFGPKYTFECTACGKKFVRTSYNATLKPHKDKHGYPCYGRMGFHVKTE